MKYFSFDAETDGLYGDTFAIGAVLIDSDGTILDSFSGKCVTPGIESVWVRENSLPHLDNLPDFESRAKLGEAFWEFYLRHREGSVVLTDVPYPVEAQLLRRCVEIDPETRAILGPYPLIDVASMLYARGFDPHLDRRAFGGYSGPVHNPLDDAIASALCAIRLTCTE